LLPVFETEIELVIIGGIRCGLAAIIMFVLVAAPRLVP